MTRSNEDIARFIQDTGIAEGVFPYGFDDCNKGAWSRIAEKVAAFINATELEAFLQKLEETHKDRPILFAAIQHIRDVTTEKGIEAVGDAADFFYRVYTTSDPQSREELESWVAYGLLSSKY
jgi:hypothetical protein